jgi:hypothetical protein
MVKAPGAKGYELEEILRLYFLQSGLFAVRSVPIVVRGEELTDIDLWLYERPSGSMRRRILVDAKFKTKPKAAERLLWAKGAQQSLGLDGAYVATTDKRPVLRDIARQFEVLLLDGVDLDRIASSARLQVQLRLSEDELLTAIRGVDAGRHTREWIDAVRLAKSALVDGLGAAGVNRALDQFDVFARGAASAHPGSPQARLAARGAYICAAIIAINLDFIAATVAFRPPEERHRVFVNAIRYGNQEKGDGLTKVRLATALVRQYVKNGKALASQLEQAFGAEADAIPAEIIADTAIKMQKSDQIFGAARELEAAGYAREVQGFDQLPTDAKTLFGTLLDFVACPRDAFAEATAALPAPTGRPSEVRDGISTDIAPEAGISESGDTNAGPLFNPSAPAKDG